MVSAWPKCAFAARIPGPRGGAAASPAPGIAAPRRLAGPMCPDTRSGARQPDGLQIEASHPVPREKHGFCCLRPSSDLEGQGAELPRRSQWALPSPRTWFLSLTEFSGRTHFPLSISIGIPISGSSLIAVVNTKKANEMACFLPLFSLRGAQRPARGPLWPFGGFAEEPGHRPQRPTRDPLRSHAGSQAALSSSLTGETSLPPTPDRSTLAHREMALALSVGDHSCAPASLPGCASGRKPHTGRT